MKKLEIFSDRIAGIRSVFVQPPPVGFATQCIVFLDGELYIDRVHAPFIVEQMQKSEALPPIMFLYLGAGGPAARHQDFTCNADYTEFLARDLSHWIERYVGSFERTYLVGLSLSGLAVAHTALKYPTNFQGGLCQSPSAWWNNEWLTKQIDGCRALPRKLWLSVGDQERTANVSHPPTDLFQGTSQLDSVRRLFERLTAAGAEVKLNTYEGGHDPKCWAEELPSALTWLLGDNHEP